MSRAASSGGPTASAGRVSMPEPRLAPPRSSVRHQKPWTWPVESCRTDITTRARKGASVAADAPAAVVDAAVGPGVDQMQLGRAAGSLRRGVEQGDVPSARFRFRVAVDFLGLPAPGVDVAAGVEGEKGVALAALEQFLEMGLRFAEDLFDAGAPAAEPAAARSAARALAASPRRRRRCHRATAAPASSPKARPAATYNQSFGATADTAFRPLARCAVFPGAAPFACTPHKNLVSSGPNVKRGPAFSSLRTAAG